jgi:hypothetical protein
MTGFFMRISGGFFFMSLGRLVVLFAHSVSMEALARAVSGFIAL